MSLGTHTELVEVFNAVAGFCLRNLVFRYFLSVMLIGTLIFQGIGLSSRDICCERVIKAILCCNGFLIETCCFFKFSLFLNSKHVPLIAFLMEPFKDDANLKDRHYTA